MPWKELDVVDQRLEFVLRALHEQVPFAALCREHGISRRTGYKFLERFKQEGMAGLQDQSRRPQTSPRQLSEDVVCELIRLKQAHRTWGARKLLEVYRRLHAPEKAPSESSCKRVLEKAGLVEHRRRRSSRDSGRLQHRIQPQAPNELWSVDFKGWWYSQDQKRCEPLTVQDGYSRFLLC